MSGDDLTICLFFVSLALPAFGLEAVKAETAPRRIGFGTLSIACLLIGLFWLQIKEIWPPLTEAVTRLATNPLAWFIVLMFVLAVFAFHRPKERRVKADPITPVKITAETPEAISPAPEQRVFIDTTAEYLLGIRRQENMSRIQTDKLLAPYLGNWLKVTGTVHQIYDRMIWVRIGNPEPVSDRLHVILMIDDEWKPRFHLLELNKTISAIGRIRDVSYGEVELEHCELA